MVKNTTLGLLVLLVIVVTASACDATTSPTSPTPTSVATSSIASMQSQSVLLARGVDILIAHPVAYGRTIFWPQFQYPAGTSIYGYDIDASRYFTVTEEAGVKSSIVSNGQVVAWVDGDTEAGNTTVSVHDLTTGKETKLFAGSHIADGGPTQHIALDGSRLYHEAATIHVYDLATGSDSPFSLGRNPIATDGIVLWGQRQPTTPVPTETPTPTLVPGAPLPDEEDHSYIGSPFGCDLHMAKADGSITDQIIGSTLVDSGGSCGSEMGEYSISGTRIVWARGYLASGAITIYDVSTGQSQDIVKNATLSRPVLSGDILVWTESPGGSNGPGGWSIHARNLATGVEWVVVPECGNTVQQSWAIAEDKLIFTVGSYNDKDVDLLMTDLEPSK